MFRAASGQTVGLPRCRRVQPTQRGMSGRQSVTRTWSWRHLSAELAVATIGCTPTGLGRSTLMIWHHKSLPIRCGTDEPVSLVRLAVDHSITRPRWAARATASVRLSAEVPGTDSCNAANLGTRGNDLFDNFVAHVSRVAGSSMPSAVAVLRFVTSRKRVSCSSGSSAGLAPLRIRSTKLVAGW
jgi:hypothetical protein